MPEYNYIETPIIPENPKVVPNEQLHVYVPVATYDSKGIVSIDRGSLLITADGKLLINDVFIEILLAPKFNEIGNHLNNIPVFTKETLPENPPKSYWYFKNEDEGRLEVQLWLDGITRLTSSSDHTYIRRVQADSFGSYFNGYYELTGKDFKKLKEFTEAENPYVPNLEGTRSYACYAVVNGKNSTVPYTVSPDAGAIAKRDDNGTLKAADPVTDGDLATKKYVDDSFVRKYQGNGTYQIIYGSTNNGEKIFPATSSNEVNSVILRGIDGRASIYDPIEDDNIANKRYVDSELAKFDFIKVVDNLPEEGLINKIYFVPKGDPHSQDLFDEYLWVNNDWEWITTHQLEVDLTPYATYEYVNNSFITKHYADANLATKLYVDDAIQQAFANIARAEGSAF